MSVQVLDGATIMSFVEDDEAFTGSIQERFVLLDTDHNGVLSYTEMLTELQSLRVLETHFGIDVETDQDELNRVYDNLFLLFDHDSNGSVDMDEYKAEMKCMMLAMAEGLGFSPVQMALEEDSLLMKAVERECTSLIK
ncbi:EF-Hand 1 [Heracleum sosnowskyi]|uniref:EF-Hand 1 n=1 Tax=Heracleum sosnowskyi TaxID=360622 RepID=A0AAD8IQ06_9APIA|nr:EF-Hand 1 [Heracleum sosnowskyi]KAK1389108.1 EF-Hand 1 [Heracleum sosnowskyi]